MCYSQIITLEGGCVMRRFVFVLGLLLVCGTAFAQTPDEETPANEGVCDVLIGGTPGLYGLCVAYCEAMDCHLDGDGLPQCKNANATILKNYDRKKQPGDPDMPCLLPDCPCFTQEELENLPPPAGVDCWLEDPGTSDDFWGKALGFCGNWDASVIGIVNFREDIDSREDEKWCFYSDASGVRRFKEFYSRDEGHAGEAWACFNTVYQACLNRGDCVFVTDFCPNYPAP